MLHGYGADGQDLIELARQWGTFLPDAAFVAPHAPYPCEANPMGGRQWFALTFRDPGEYWRGVNEAAPALTAFIESESRSAGLPLSSVALLGFSQGTMMALHTGPRLAEPLAAIIGFSGHLAGPEHLLHETKSRPPVLLVHGSSDPVIPVEALHLARIGLASAEIPVQWSIRPGLGHGIDPQGLQTAGFFLRNAFEAAPRRKIGSDAAQVSG
jgi:phospholipase/carboxylesterase